MKDFAKGIDSAARTLTAVLGPLFSIVLVLLIGATLATQMGFPLRIVRTLAPTELAYLCGAVWLWRRAAS